MALLPVPRWGRSVRRHAADIRRHHLRYGALTREPLPHLRSTHTEPLGEAIFSAVDALDFALELSGSHRWPLCGRRHNVVAIEATCSGPTAPLTPDCAVP